MNFASSMLGMRKIVLILVVFSVIFPLLWAQPMKQNGPRKSCGRDLVERVDRICQSRGGHMTYTRARRVRRGIVNECCMNKCADSNIYAYCSNDKQNSEAEAVALLLDPPVVATDLEVAESRAAAAHLIDAQNTIQSRAEFVTSAPIEKYTFAPDHRYHDIYVKNNVDSEFVNRLIKTLPHSSNDFQVGTVPPEYLISRYIPSRARTVTNYQQ